MNLEPKRYSLHFCTAFTKKAEEGEPGARRKTTVVGPWGSIEGGSSWDDGRYNGVREITLVYDRCIDSIRVTYDQKGKPVYAEMHGGNGGHHTANIRLQYPEEFLTTVSGHYCPLVQGGPTVIRSLTFKSNRRTFGPFGVEEGTPFSFPMDGALIVGFQGKSGWYLDAIGFHLSCPHSNLISKIHQKLQKLGAVAMKSLSPKNGEEAPHATLQRAHA